MFTSASRKLYCSKFSYSYADVPGGIKFITNSEWRLGRHSTTGDQAYWSCTYSECSSSHCWPPGRRHERNSRAESPRMQAPSDRLSSAQTHAHVPACLSPCLAVYRSISLFVYLSNKPKPIWLSINHSINQTNNQSINQSINQPMNQSLNQSIHPPTHPPIHPSTHPPIHPPTHPSIQPTKQAIKSIETNQT